MKKILPVVCLLLSASCAHVNSLNSLTKEELIEKLIVANRAEPTFYEGIEKTMNELQSSGRLNSDVMGIMKNHCTWESWKPYYVSVINETYSRDEVEGLIHYWKSLPPGSDWIMKKHLDEQVKMAFTLKEWQKTIWDKIKPDIHELPREEEKQPTYAGCWKAFSERDKLLYIKGVLDASQATITLNMGKLSLAMDALYEDEKNQNVAYHEILRMAEQNLQTKDASSPKKTEQ